MRKWIVGGVVAALLSAGGAALATSSGNPGPNGHNTYGLCTAYFSGSGQGMQQKAAHGVAFVQLAAQAAAWDAQEDGPSGGDDGSPQAAASESSAQQVQEYCAANGQRP